MNKIFSKLRSDNSAITTSILDIHGPEIQLFSQR